MARQGIPSKYVTIGLRQDKNLSDVPDPTTALNNLLNNLVSDGDSTENFISEDLDAIRGLQNTNINTEILSTLSGTTVNYSVQTTDPESGNLIVKDIPVVPTVTLKDRIDNIRSVTGSIPAYLGGTGLLARYVDSTDINTGIKTSTGATIFDINDDPITGQKKEIFWLSGTFKFPSVLDKSFKNQYGGIQWTGYFSPMIAASYIDISVSTTGLFIFEYDLNDTGNWVTAYNLYSDVRTFTRSEEHTSELQSH